MDLRRGHDGLSTLVRARFGMDPLDGHLFVFVGRRVDRVKILFWDRGGFVLYYKRVSREGGSACRAAPTASSSTGPSPPCCWWLRPRGRTPHRGLEASRARPPRRLTGAERRTKQSRSLTDRARFCGCRQHGAVCLRVDRASAPATERALTAAEEVRTRRYRTCASEASGFRILRQDEAGGCSPLTAELPNGRNFSECSGIRTVERTAP